MSRYEYRILFWNDKFAPHQKDLMGGGIRPLPLGTLAMARHVRGEYSVNWKNVVIERRQVGRWEKYG